MCGVRGARFRGFGEKIPRLIGLGGCGSIAGDVGSPQRPIDGNELK